MNKTLMVLQMKKIYLIFAVVLIFVSSCSQQKNDVIIDFYQTSDIHGAIFPYNFINNKNETSSLAQVHGFITDKRKNKERVTILMDNGDILQGQPSVYYSNFVETEPVHLVARVMNFMKYNVGVVGNHDIEPGHAVYDKINNEFKFPWLAANAVIAGTNEPYFQPYVYLKRDKIKIAIIGLITPNIPNWLPPSIFEGIDFLDMEESAKHWIEVVKRKHDPDIIIGVFHAGIGSNDAGHLDENASKRIAINVPGFDAIFCGHDHQKYVEELENIDGNKVWMLDPSSRASYISHLTVNMKWNSSKNTYDKTLSANLVDVSKLVIDSTFMNKFSSDFEQIKTYVNEDVAILEEDLNSENLFYGDNKFMDLIHRVQLGLSNADISFAAPLQYSLNIPKGKIKVADLFKLYRFENLLYTMELSGEEIKNYLEFSYSLWINTMNNENDQLLNYKNGSNSFKNPFYNFDSAEGIVYSVDLRKQLGERIKIDSFVDGRIFDLNTKYKVAINSYRGNGGGGHLEMGAKINKSELNTRIINSTDKDLRYYMMEYLKKEKNIHLNVNNNWKMIPEKWVQIAKNKQN